MLALISPAKTMKDSAVAESFVVSEKPRFETQTKYIISLMLQYSAVELVDIFKVSLPIAKLLRSRFLHLAEGDDNSLAAVDSYDGVVYKHFKGEFSSADQHYLQSHVRISSLLYGLLRPFDQIHPYRMEGFVRLAGSDKRVDHYWRDHQTQTLIDDVNATGGTLLYLASKEEQNAFYWREVRKAVRVIDFQFLQHRGDKLRQVVVYTKMARGEMIRFMLERGISDPEELKHFEWGGYRYQEQLSTPDVWVWVME